MMVTDAVPGVVSSEAGTIAVSWPELTNVVWSAEPFQVTLLAAEKLDPFTVSVRTGLPAGTEPGERLVSVGTGGVTVKFTELVVYVLVEHAPTATYILAVSGWVNKLAGTVATICVEVGVPAMFSGFGAALADTAQQTAIPYG